MVTVVPAILPSSQDDLAEKLERLAAIPAVSRIQIDIVDGVPKSDFGSSVQLPHLDRIEYEIDIMCRDALRAADDWLSLGASRLVFHAGSTSDLPLLFSGARKRYGEIVSCGLALAIDDDIALVEEAADKITFAQLMGIARIGRQGEPFDERVFERARAFRKRYPDTPLQVDGGVSLGNARGLFALGVDTIVVGSALLRASDPAATFAQLESLHNQLQA